MERGYQIRDFTISVQLEERAVHIINSRSLWDMLNDDRLANSNLLVRSILKDHEEFFRRPLGITIESLIVEIWGHVYIDYFTRALQDMVKIQPVKALVEKIVQYCAVIDCGETGIDNNRFVWDLLSGQIITIDKMLPDEIDTNLLQ